MTVTPTATPVRAATPSVVQRFLTRRGSWVPVFAALLILIIMFVAAQAYFGNSGGRRDASNTDGSPRMHSAAWRQRWASNDTAICAPS